MTVPLERGRAVSSVTLPADPGAGADLHVFAASVRPRTARLDRQLVGEHRAATPASGRGRTRRCGSSCTPPRAGRAPGSGWRTPSPPRPCGSATPRSPYSGTARPDSGARCRCTFDGGHAGTVIPAGAQAVSDPVGFQVPADTNLLVSIHLPEPVAAAPVHSEAIQRSYLSAAAAATAPGRAGRGAFTGSLTVWPFLTGVDVQGGPGSVVTLGDSITDGVQLHAGRQPALARRARPPAARPAGGAALRRAQPRHLGEPRRHRPLSRRRRQHGHGGRQRPAPAGAGRAGPDQRPDGRRLRGHQRRAVGRLGRGGHRRAEGASPQRAQERGLRVVGGDLDAV